MYRFSSSKSTQSLKHVSALTASMLIGTGCSASEDPLAGVRYVGGSGGDSEEPAPALASSSACTLINQTRSCLCGSVPGVQTCLGSDWSQCDCYSDEDVAPLEEGQLAGDEEVINMVPPGNQREELVFDWLRTPPVGGSCVPGHYEGTFECDLSDGVNSWGKVTGPVTIVLERSEINGEYLVIADGNMEGFAEEWVSPINAKLEGRLDCTTSEFEATTIDGHYLMLSVFDGPFNGVLEGNYNRLTWQLAGEWHLIDDFHIGFNCLGPWYVDYVGP